MINIRKWYNELNFVTQKLLRVLAVYVGYGTLIVLVTWMVVTFGMRFVIALSAGLVVALLCGAILLIMFFPLFAAIGNWYKCTDRTILTSITNTFKHSLPIIKDAIKEFVAPIRDTKPPAEESKELITAISELSISIGRMKLQGTCKECESFVSTDTKSKGLCVNTDVNHLEMNFIPHEKFGCIFFTKTPDNLS